LIASSAANSNKLSGARALLVPPLHFDACYFAAAAQPP
jgi:hypothetical protein